MEQAERIRELDRFKAGDIAVLVASDVAARGLDVKGVSHVFNYDVPWHPDDYVHRVGRTGRAGAKGKAFTLATPDDAEAIANIEKLTGVKIERVGKPAAREQAPTTAEHSRPARKQPDAQPKDAGKRAPEPRPAETRSAEPRRAEQKPVRDPVPARASRPDPQRLVDEDDDGWNGPLPDFLGVKLCA